MFNVAPEQTEPIAVFVHVYYPDIWQGMSAILAQRLKVPFRLIVTSPRAQDEIILPRTPALLSSQFIRVENRGRDILPFLVALANTEDFDIGLKLHTKKSPQREDGEFWRTDILNSILPGGRGATDIITQLRNDARIGLVAPEGFCLSVRPWILQNEGALRRAMVAIGDDLDDRKLDDVFFAAGSMFWFRRAALAPLTSSNLPPLFEAEEGQFDGTLAHAAERLFPVVARRQGFVSLSVLALSSSSPACADKELLRLARSHADAPSRYFPAPYVPALPLQARSRQFRVPARLARLYRLSFPERLRLSLRRLMGRSKPSDQRSQ
jgi:lipopolysaccharide biosynthesis protein